jgi:MEMO1 family protein
MIHSSRGAGRWYPGDRHTLSCMVNRYLEDARVPDTGEPVLAAVAPHAGYRYSGPVAAHVYRVLRDRARAGYAPETVVVLGVSHRASFPGVVLLDGSALATPLGAAPLDHEAGRFLVDSGTRIRFDSAQHGDEHSAENQIPFLQVALPQAKTVVALMGDLDDSTVDDLVTALVALADRQSLLLIASSDLLHDPDYVKVAATDRRTLGHLERMDEAALLDAWSGPHQTCCGLGPVLTVLRYAAARGVTRGATLCYRNSGDDFPESRGQWVVGYGAVIYPAPGI